MMGTSGLFAMKARASDEMEYATSLFNGLENGSMIETSWYIIGLLDCIEMMTGSTASELIEQLYPDFIVVFNADHETLATKGTR